MLILRIGWELKNNMRNTQMLASDQLYHIIDFLESDYMSQWPFTPIVMVQQACTVRQNLNIETKFE